MLLLEHNFRLVLRPDKSHTTNWKWRKAAEGLTRLHGELLTPAGIPRGSVWLEQPWTG